VAAAARLGGTGRWIAARGALGLVLAAVITGSSESAPTRLPSPVDLGGTLPAAFVANRGQLPAGVRFATAGAGYAFALDPDGVRIALAGPSGKVRLALRFVAPGGRTRITGADALGARVSYFLGPRSGTVARRPADVLDRRLSRCLAGGRCCVPGA
jgi:hypothetical protein